MPTPAHAPAAFPQPQSAPALPPSVAIFGMAKEGSRESGRESGKEGKEGKKKKHKKGR
jgi:hypothetical protein